MEMSNPFLDLADTGKNAWWRYVLGVLLVLMMWMIGTVIIITPVTLQIVNEASPFGLALALVTFAPMLLGPMLVTRWLHGRPVATLVGPERRLNWRRIGVGALLWLVLVGLATLVDALLRPGQYMLNPAFLQNLPLLLVGLFLIPLQTSAEEVFFRGYLLQATGRLTRNVWMLSVIQRRGVHPAAPRQSRDGRQCRAGGFELVCLRLFCHTHHAAQRQSRLRAGHSCRQ